MSLRISFELSDKDLEHFALIMREARKATAGFAPEDIVAEAETLLHAMDESDSPGFIAERIQKLRLMIQMLSDVEWRLPHQDATRVLNALAYFSEPEDLIRDARSAPGRRIDGQRGRCGEVLAGKTRFDRARGRCGERGWT